MLLNRRFCENFQLVFDIDGNDRTDNQDEWEHHIFICHILCYGRDAQGFHSIAIDDDAIVFPFKKDAGFLIKRDFPFFVFNPADAVSDSRGVKVIFSGRSDGFFQIFVG